MRFLIAFLCAACCAIAQNSPIPKGCEQVIVVTTDTWNAVDGQLHCFERKKGTRWKERGDAVDVVVGRNGMGLAADKTLPVVSKDNLPTKHEGDRRSPAGIFALPYAFGYAPTNESGWIKLPYVQCTTSFECVDDGKSIYYNQVIDSHYASKHDWKSSEKMLRNDVVYRWGLFIDHNRNKRAGDGSCIFMHIWEGPHKGTTGCTAMDEVDLKRVIAWLDPKARPLLVQFPQAEYSQLQKSWQLPMIRR
jgi:L,D-peptidoglycan transpeptidase YkuD (ErfK/YbiS/YcfS/YnhG family)